jgi:hypothetical protein
LQELEEREMAEAQGEPDRRCPWQPSSAIPEKIQNKKYNKKTKNNKNTAKREIQSKEINLRAAIVRQLFGYCSTRGGLE